MLKRKPEIKQARPVKYQEDTTYPMLRVPHDKYCTLALLRKRIHYPTSISDPRTSVIQMS